MTGKRQEQSFEANLKALEKIVDKLEKGSTTLDEAIDLFQRGRGLSKECEVRLKEAELKIQQLVDEEDAVNEAPFEAADEE